MAVPALVDGVVDLTAVVGLLVVFALVVLVVYRWLADSGDGDREATAGTEIEGEPPLASWRWVYDVDKADADREMANVHRQADTLADADEKARR